MQLLTCGKRMYAATIVLRSPRNSTHSRVHHTYVNKFICTTFTRYAQTVSTVDRSKSALDARSRPSFTEHSAVTIVADQIFRQRLSPLFCLRRGQGRENTADRSWDSHWHGRLPLVVFLFEIYFQRKRYLLR